jgi:hypothetical protein
LILKILSSWWFQYLLYFSLSTKFLRRFSPTFFNLLSFFCFNLLSWFLITNVILWVFFCKYLVNDCIDAAVNSQVILVESFFIDILFDQLMLYLDDEIIILFSWKRKKVLDLNIFDGLHNKFLKFKLHSCPYLILNYWHSFRYGNHSTEFSKHFLFLNFLLNLKN